MFFFQLGTALGVTVSSVVFDRVLDSRATDNGITISSTGTSNEPQWLTLPAYRAAQWSCFAFGMCGESIDDAVYNLRMSTNDTILQRAPSLSSSSA